MNVFPIIVCDAEHSKSNFTAPKSLFYQLFPDVNSHGE